MVSKSTMENGTVLEYPELLSFGNPLLDVTLIVEDTKLHEKFNLPIDGQLEVSPEQSALFDLVMKRNDISFSAGGCALNTSRVFSWVLQKANTVAFVGGIGNDIEASKLNQIIKKSHIITRFNEVEDKKTGMCIALVLGAERCLSGNIGAASVCEPDHVFNSSVLPYLSNCKIIYVEAYFITHSFKTALQIAQFAKKHNKLFAFNLCGSYVCEQYPSYINDILPYVDMLFGFIEEYKTFENFSNLSKLCESQADNSIVHSVKKILDQLQPIISTRIQSFNHCLANDAYSLPLIQLVKQNKLTIMTQGPNPLLCSLGLNVLEKKVKPVDKNDIVDTTGAGDSFVGGFLAALVNEENLDNCLNCGMWAAQQLLRQKGCTIPLYKANFLNT